MVKMNFKNQILEKIFRNYKWTRNNSILLLLEAMNNDVLNFMPTSSKFEFQTIEHQFKCLVTTTDAYIHGFTNDKKLQFGILQNEDGGIIQKKDLSTEQLIKVLPEQILSLENIFKNFDDTEFEENLKSIQSIINHEYLHQGQLIVMLREAGVELPERFKNAFAL